MATTHWDWTKFRGSDAALKYARRDLPHLDTVIGLVRKRRVVVQAGGNLGIYPKALAQWFEKVITFEPDGELFGLGLLNAPERNIVRFQAALGESRGFVGLSRARRDGSPRPTHEGLTHVVPGADVEMMPLDDLTLPICDLIYLDVEGFEYQVLKGAVQTVERCRPVIALEINKHLVQYGVKRETILQWMGERGYRWHTAVGSDEVFVPLDV